VSIHNIICIVDMYIIPVVLSLLYIDITCPSGIEHSAPFGFIKLYIDNSDREAIQVRVLCGNLFHYVLEGKCYDRERKLQGIMVLLVANLPSNTSHRPPPFSVIFCFERMIF
jgi:hypothetical protein